ERSTHRLLFWFGVVASFAVVLSSPWSNHPHAVAASGGPVQRVGPPSIPEEPYDTPSGAQHGHPGKVVFHRTKAQPRGAPGAAASAVGTSNLTYHGGPVERTSSTNYAIYWQPAGSYMSPNYQALLNRYFTDIGGS